MIEETKNRQSENEHQLLKVGDAKRLPTKESILTMMITVTKDLSFENTKLPSENLHQVQHLSHLLIANRVSTRRTWRTTSWRQGTTLRF